MYLRSMMWWIDRWRQSSAFMDLTLEEQGAYRNLIDEAWLRGADGEGIPNRESVLAKASGANGRWSQVKKPVLAHFELRGTQWFHPTVDYFRRRTERFALKQRAYRERKKQAAVTHPVTQAVTRRSRKR